MIAATIVSSHMVLDIIVQLCLSSVYAAEFVNPVKLKLISDDGLLGRKLGA
jgi:hypothetical protein